MKCTMYSNPCTEMRWADMALCLLHDHIWPGHLRQTLSSLPGQTRIPTFCWCNCSERGRTWSWLGAVATGCQGPGLSWGLVEAPPGALCHHMDHIPIKHLCIALNGYNGIRMLFRTAECKQCKKACENNHVNVRELLDTQALPLCRIKERVPLGTRNIASEKKWENQNKWEN